LRAKANAFSAGISRIFIDGLAAAAKELDLPRGGAELLDSWRIAVNHK
jgi:hypothetical protein